MNLKKESRGPQPILTKKKGARPSLLSAFGFLEYPMSIKQQFRFLHTHLPSPSLCPAPLDTISTCNQFRLNDCLSLRLASWDHCRGDRGGKHYWAHWRSSISSSITKNCSSHRTLLTYTHYTHIKRGRNVYRQGQPSSSNQTQTKVKLKD